MNCSSVVTGGDRSDRACAEFSSHRCLRFGRLDQIRTPAHGGHRLTQVSMRAVTLGQQLIEAGRLPSRVRSGSDRASYCEHLAIQRPYRFADRLVVPNRSAVHHPTAAGRQSRSP